METVESDLGEGEEEDEEELSGQEREMVSKLCRRSGAGGTLWGWWGGEIGRPRG